MNEARALDARRFSFTLEQIGRLERGLLSLRKSDRASPKVLEAIAAVQYREILRLRAELDAAMGFEEQPCDLMVSLRGPSIALGVTPAVDIVKVLTSLRAAMMSVTGFLSTGELPRRGGFPAAITRPSEFKFAGVTGGSVKLKLNLPGPQTLFPNLEKQYAENGIKLILQTVEWTGSYKGLGDFKETVEDDKLMRLLLAQVRRVAPSPRGSVQRVEFTGRLVQPGKRYALSRTSSNRIRDAIREEARQSIITTETGKLRSVDIDSGVFSLRQRPDNRPDLRCYIPPRFIEQAIGFLVQDTRIALTGRLVYNKRGLPSSLRVEEFYGLGSD